MLQRIRTFFHMLSEGYYQIGKGMFFIVASWVLPPRTIEEIRYDLQQRLADMYQRLDEIDLDPIQQPHEPDHLQHSDG